MDFYKSILWTIRRRPSRPSRIPYCFHAVGLEKFLNALNNGVSRQAIAAVILNSEEFHADLVTALHEHYLQRGPHPTGFNLFLEWSYRRGLIAALLGSNEYFISVTD
jgi:hypothetical protein